MNVRRARSSFFLALAGALVVAASASAYMATGTREVTIEIRHSRFSVDEVRVKRGETIRFVVRNTDPIDHELIVGPTDVQDRHETGSEPHHGERDGEVSVALFETATTSYRFADDGIFYFGCHLPGHWDYGMRGRIIVG